MANLTQFKKTSSHKRSYRYFSVELKQKLVSDIDNNLITVAEISREYEVSRSAVTKWRAKYSVHYQHQTRQIVEAMSDTRKIQMLKARIKELEHCVGVKQIQLEFYEKMIELAEEDYGIEIKKKENTGLSSGIGKTGQK